jgi:transposase InsO family protein
LCVQDRLSRYLIFAPMHDATAITTTRTFMAYWICQFGIPKRIVTDRGSNFMSALFQELCRFLGVTHSPTTAYRPQGNAENERSHRELHAYIAIYLQTSTKATWDLLLAHAAFVHNSSFHASLPRSPS